MSRIFFYTAWDGIDPNPRAGGPKVLQKHVQILQEHGLEARVVLGGKSRWLARLNAVERDLAVKEHDFENRIAAHDVVVVPAIHSADVDAIPGRRKVILIQNGGLLFDTLPLESGMRHPWHHPDVEAVICVSEYDRRLLELTEPSCPVHRVYNQVDPDRFEPVTWDERDDLILASPLNDYKNPWHTKAVCHLVVSRSRARRERTAADGPRRPSVRVIQGLPPEEVETLLARAKVLVFLSVVEGFALLPLEAMMAGTPVVAYENQAHSEYMPDDYRHGLSDFESMVTTVEKMLDIDADDPWHRVREDAHDRARDYGAARQRESVVGVWERILK